MPQQLTARQRAFVREYLKDYNASAACLRAGYETKNPHVMGSKLLNSVNIKAALGPGVNFAKSEAKREIREWREHVESIAYSSPDPETLTYDHKIKGLDLLAKVDGLYQSESGFTQAFQINIHLGGDKEE